MSGSRRTQAEAVARLIAGYGWQAASAFRDLGGILGKVSMPEEPSDAMLLELGRLTWAAINLEDVIPSMRRAMGQPPARLDRAPISEWVSNALGVLVGWPESGTRQPGT